MLRINVLGGLYVTSDGRPLAGVTAQPRRLALLSLLVVAGDSGVTRNTLVAYLWPDGNEEDGAQALTQALYALRRELGSDEAILGMKDLRLNPDVVTSDVADFRDSAATGDLDRAAGLWRGPFLEGFHLPGADTFERWVEDQRAGLQHDYTVLLDELGGRALDRGDARIAAGVPPAVAFTPAVSEPPSPTSEKSTMLRDSSGWATVKAPSEIVQAPRESDVGPRRIVRVVSVVVGAIILLSGYLVWRGLRSALRGEP